MNTIKDNNHTKTKSIRIDLSEKEHARLSEYAHQMKHSLRGYAKLKVLDTATGVEDQRRRVFQLMPAFYNLVAEIEDRNTREALKEIGGKLCRSLK